MNKTILLLISIIFLNPLIWSEEECDRNHDKSIIPDISLIADFSLNRYSTDTSELYIPGFGSHHHHHGGSDNKSFNLNYAELFMKSSVDRYFDLTAIFHLSNNDFEIEELYAETKNLPLNLNIRIGKFFSRFGKLNSVHLHFHDFKDVPFIYEAILGDHGLQEKGLGVIWNIPVKFSFQLGVELLNGENRSSFGNRGFHVIDHDTEKEIEISDTAFPNLKVFFLKSSFNTGNLNIEAGISYAAGDIKGTTVEDGNFTEGMKGKTDLYGFDLTLKYSIDKDRFISLQSEYIYRKTSGTLYKAESHDHEDEEGGHEHDAVPEAEASDIVKKQSGIYTQLVFRFHKNWSAGIRYDRIFKNDIKENSISASLPDNLYRWSGMLELKPSDLTKIRLQYNINRYKYSESLKKNHSELFLQLQFAIGSKRCCPIHNVSGEHKH